MSSKQVFEKVKGVLGILMGLVLYLVIGGFIIYLISRGCPGNHSYMNVGR